MPSDQLKLLLWVDLKNRLDCKNWIMIHFHGVSNSNSSDNSTSVILAFYHSSTSKWFACHFWSSSLISSSLSPKVWFSHIFDRSGQKTLLPIYASCLNSSAQTPLVSWVNQMMFSARPSYWHLWLVFSECSLVPLLFLKFMVLSLVFQCLRWAVCLIFFVCFSKCQGLEKISMVMVSIHYWS